MKYSTQAEIHRKNQQMFCSQFSVDRVANNLGIDL